MSQVKIVATIGPRTNNADALKGLRDAGMSVARLNGSYGDFEWHTGAIGLLRDAVPDVPVLLDIPGRKIRLTTLEGEFRIEAGDSVVLSTEPGHNGREKITVTYPDLHREMTAGDRILADGGALRLTVEEISGRDVRCRAESAGILRSTRGVHVPGISLQGKFISQRDSELIDFAGRSGVDFVGVSFVDTAEQVESVRALIGNLKPAIVSKVETKGAIDSLKDIVLVSDGVMIDRGDLALETSSEYVALLQKKILAEARRVACPVIVATEMLQSMISSPTPTKAEVSDITNAVLDGATALMLSDETAVGEFPLETVDLMRRVADAASEHLALSVNGSETSNAESMPEAMGDAIALICRRLNVTKIVAVTISGFAARTVASTLPRQPILAVTNDAAAVRGFNLLRGTTGVQVDLPFSRTSMDHIPLCLEELWRRGQLVDDDLILVTAVSYPKSGNRMNLIETHKVSDLRDSLGWSR